MRSKQSARATQCQELRHSYSNLASIQLAHLSVHDTQVLCASHRQGSWGWVLTQRLPCALNLLKGIQVECPTEVKVSTPKF